MKRGAPLQRKTPLRSAGFAARPRGSDVRRVADRARDGRPPRIPADVVRLIRDRSQGLCEIGLICGGMAAATESAHRMGKGIGGVGPKNFSSNVASDLLRGCHRDHALIDGAKVSDARAMGWKVRHGVALPREVPVYHARLGWVLLDDAGGWLPAPGSSIHSAGPVPVVQLPLVDLSGEGVPLALIDALDRFGHLDCGGWSYTSGEALHCACGGQLFIALEVDG